MKFFIKDVGASSLHDKELWLCGASFVSGLEDELNSSPSFPSDVELQNVRGSDLGDTVTQQIDLTDSEIKAEKGQIISRSHGARLVCGLAHP